MIQIELLVPSHGSAITIKVHVRFLLSFVPSFVFFDYPLWIPRWTSDILQIAKYVSSVSFAAKNITEICVPLVDLKASISILDRGMSTGFVENLQEASRHSADYKSRPPCCTSGSVCRINGPLARCETRGGNGRDA